MFFFFFSFSGWPKWMPVVKVIKEVTKWENASVKMIWTTVLKNKNLYPTLSNFIIYVYIYIIFFSFHTRKSILSSCSPYNLVTYVINRLKPLSLVYGLEIQAISPVWWMWILSGLSVIFPYLLHPRIMY